VSVYEVTTAVGETAGAGIGDVVLASHSDRGFDATAVTQADSLYYDVDSVLGAYSSCHKTYPNVHFLSVQTKSRYQTHLSIYAQ
jgi:hypothetical protein